jgi:poly(A) polymerase
LLRLLVAPRGPELVRWMQEYGVLMMVLPAAPRPALLGRLAGIEAGLGLGPDPILRLAALGLEVGEDADRLRDRLRLSNEEHARLARLGARSPDAGATVSEQADRACLYAAGAAAYRDGILLSWARSGASPDDPSWRHRYASPERWQPPRFPLGGDDVMALGIPAGPSVGKLLRDVESWWIAGDFVADETALRAKLRELAGRA